MRKIPFSEKELEVVGEIPHLFGPGFPPTKVYNRPVTEKENIRLAFTEKCPVYHVGNSTGVLFSPEIIPDDVARGFVLETKHIDNNTEAGGPDMFGIQWEYVPQVGGSMVRPGKPTLEDANDWKEVIKFPDIDSWDWEGSAKANEPWFEKNKDRWVTFWFLTGAWFERLVSFMEFQNAAEALIDEDQQDAVKELFEATTDLMCRIVDKVKEYYPAVDCICAHDDWGSQQAPFFSQATAMEMIVPYMKKFTDHCHEKGFVAEMHSCGHTESRIECYIAGGWDVWNPQPMNDFEKLWTEYGDRILLPVNVKGITAESSEEEQRAAAKEYARKFCKPGKPALQGTVWGADAFNEELYKQSRFAYMGELE